MKITKQRKKILSFLKENHGAFSAKDIHKALPEMDLVTIYRNLKTFSENGHIKTVNINSSEKMYEYFEEDHEHAICNTCGDLKHVHLNKNKVKEMLEIEGFNIKDLEILVKGECNNHK